MLDIWCMTLKIAHVIIPTDDQDRALTFYAEVLDFEKRAELSFGGGMRWIEVAPAGSSFSTAHAMGARIARKKDPSRAAPAASDPIFFVMCGSWCLPGNGPDAWEPMVGAGRAGTRQCRGTALVGGR